MLHVLLVDDDVLILRIVKQHLIKAEHKVTCVSSGEQAIETLQKTDPHTFQLVLTDLMMPNVDGYGLIRWIRQQKSFVHLPIVVMSSNGRSDTVQKCVSLGSDAFLLKPLRSSHIELLSEVYQRKTQETQDLSPRRKRRRSEDGKWQSMRHGIEHLLLSNPQTYPLQHALLTTIDTLAAHSDYDPIVQTFVSTFLMHLGAQRTPLMLPHPNALTLPSLPTRLVLDSHGTSSPILKQVYRAGPVHVTMPPHGKGCCNFNSLPNELLAHIFSTLDPPTLSKVSQVSKRWHAIGQDPFVWESLTRRYPWCLHPPDISSPKVAWREIFKRAYKLERNYTTFHNQPTTLTLEERSPITKVYLQDDNVILGHSKGAINIFDLKGPLHTQTLRGPCAKVCGVSGDSKGHVVVAFHNGTIRAWDQTRGLSEWEHSLNTRIDHIMFSRRYLVSSHDDTIQVWSLSTGSHIWSMGGHCKKVSCLHQAGDQLLSGSADKSIMSWDLQRGECVRAYSGHHASVTCIDWHGQTCFVSGGNDRRIHVWDHRVSVATDTLTGHDHGLIGVQLLNHTLISADTTSVRAWDLRNHAQLALYPSPNEESFTAMAASDSRIVLGTKAGNVLSFNFQ